jgi:AmmeMemoRadiSam system protein B
MIRQPAVAGSFYPADQSQLSAQLDELLNVTNETQPVKGVIVPHAGYIYSGRIAGEVFSTAAIPRQVILLGPNHHGLGENIAVSGADGWQTPLGMVPVASALRDRLVADIAAIKIDDQAHHHEHSLEVMVPFLQKRQPQIEIVPITLGHLSLDESLELGRNIAQVIAGWDEDVLLLASTDMNHFATAEESQQLDFMAITAMTSFDQRALYQIVRDNGISMCGVLPTVVVMEAAHNLGAAECQLVDYAHSGQVNGDNSRVVGYAGLILK